MEETATVVSQIWVMLSQSAKTVHESGFHIGHMVKLCHEIFSKLC
jgi:hypothetical protein